MGADGIGGRGHPAETGIGVGSLRSPRSRRLRRVASATVAGAALCLAMLHAHAQTVRLAPYVNVTETLTNNVSLQPSDQARGDLISEITPGLRIDINGPRASLQGVVSTPVVLYTKASSGGNQIYGTGNLLGRVEAIEKLFFVEAEASASQQFFTPFGAQPPSLGNATDNRYTSVSYRISPYLQGVTGGNIDYLLRYNSVWTNLSRTPVAVDNSHYNEWIATIASPVAPFGWGLDFNRTNVKFTDQDPQITQLARLKLLYQPNPELRVGIDGGYEDNRYPFSDYNGIIYGLGFDWRPSNRTSAVAKWEHRFFGSSYDVALNYRTPLLVLNAGFSRNITTYPQQVALLPAAGNVQSLVSDLLSSRYPDPTQRQTAVDQLIQDRGLPQVLTSSVTLYSQQIQLVQSGTIKAGLIGVNNSVFLTLYNTRNDPITGSGVELGPILALGNKNTQRGGAIDWTWTALPRLNLAATAAFGRTETRTTNPFTSDQWFLRVSASTSLTPQTSVSVGARYQTLRSDVPFSSYNEAAVFAGLSYTYR